MKIAPHHIVQFKPLSLDMFDPDTWDRVDQCRERVGYEDSPEWECGCRGTEEQQQAFIAQFPGHRVGGFLCFPCNLKEAHEWISCGLITPVELEQAEKYLKDFSETKQPEVILPRKSDSQFIKKIRFVLQTLQEAANEFSMKIAAVEFSNEEDHRFPYPEKFTFVNPTFSQDLFID